MSEINSGMVIDAINEMASPQRAYIVSTNDYATVDGWKLSQSLQTGLAGFLLSLIPGLHIITLPVDFTILVHKMGYAAWGVGALRYKRELKEPKEDLGIILGLWAETIEEKDLEAIFRKSVELGILSLDNAKRLTPNSLFQSPLMDTSEIIMIEKGGTKAIGMLGGVLARRIAGKVAFRMTQKASTRLLRGFLPIIGAGFNGGVNYLLIKQVADAADVYYRNKKKFMEEAANGCKKEE